MSDSSFTATLKNFKRVLMPFKYARMEYGNKFTLVKHNRRELSNLPKENGITPLATGNNIGYVIPLLH